MSLVIATPAYGNNVTAAYLRSLVRFAREAPIEWDLIMPTRNDSLIQRARNVIASKFLKTDYQRLFFIDADIEFSTDDAAKIWNLNADIGVGIYPFKGPEARYAAWHEGRLVTDLNRFDGPIAVDYAGTGFMMIDRKVLAAMYEAWPERRHEEGGEPDCFDFFSCRVHDDGQGPFFMSEDYAFCHDARQLGFRIMADPSVRLLHHGSYAYGS